VLREIISFAPWYSSIHRGKGYKSVLSSNLYEEGREIVKNFVKVDDARDVVIFTKNTTESINMLASILCQEDQEQVILCTDMEHLANDLPWRAKFTVDYVGIDAYGQLLMEDLEAKLHKYAGKVKLVTVTGASNVTGYINPIHTIAKLAHRYGAKIHVDAAQLAPHAAIDMQPYASPEHLDYLTFSAHKMYAPLGIGVLIGPKATFEQTEPVYRGGGNARLVSRQFIEWSSSPAKDEAGTPNIIGVAALTAAIKTINAVGMNFICEYEKDVISYALDGLKGIPGITLYCQREQEEDRLSLISFNIQGIYHKLLAEILSYEAGIAVRNGFFCAHSYCAKLLNLSDQDLQYHHHSRDLPLPGMVRVSLGLYNNYHEVDVLIELLNRVARNKDYYKHKYENGFASSLASSKFQYV
jgi:cysteine desulfurase / selenocysteine lyase